MRVTAISPASPGNPENPFSGMAPEQRVEEILTYCARLWARTCSEVAQGGRNSAGETPPEAGRLAA